MAQPDESFIELRDGRFKIRVLQAGSGDPLLYVHGAGGLFWDPLLDALSANHHVIAPEHPGAGDSQGLEFVEELWDLVLYYNELLDSLGVDRATVVGHSFGGMVAAEIASTSPHRVDKLVLIAPIGLWRDDHPVPDISRDPAGVAPEARLRRSREPARRRHADTRPDRPGLVVPGVPDDGEHPAVHLAAAGQGPLQADLPPAARRRCSCGAPRTVSCTRRMGRTSAT